MSNSTQRFTMVGLIAWCAVVIVRLAVVATKCFAPFVTPMESAQALEAAMPLLGIGASLAAILLVNGVRRVNKDVQETKRPITP